MLLIICLALLLLPISLILSSTLGFVLTWGTEGRPRFLLFAGVAKSIFASSQDILTVYCTTANCKNFSSCSTLAIIRRNFFFFSGQAVLSFDDKVVARGLDFSFGFFIIFVNPSH